MKEGIGEGGTEDLVLEFGMLVTVAGAHFIVCTLEPLACGHYEAQPQNDIQTDHSQHFVVLSHKFSRFYHFKRCSSQTEYHFQLMI